MDKRIIEVADNQHKYDWKPNLCMLTTNHSRFNKTACFSKQRLEMEPDVKEKADSNHVTKQTLATVLNQLYGDDNQADKSTQKTFTKNP